MASLKSILTKTLLFALPLASALPRPSSSLVDKISDGIEKVAEEAGFDVSEEVGEVIDETISILSNIITNYGAEDAIADRYIVVYNDEYDDDEINATEAFFTSEVKKRNINKRSIGGHLLSTEVHSFRLNKLRAMRLDADADMIAEIAKSKEVKFIEADAQVRATEILGQVEAPEGLVRLSHAQTGAKGYIFDASAGEGTTVYILDTGIRITHNDLAGRATFGANFADNIDDDTNGHGTHVAGTVAGTTHGVAKNAQVVAVKVLGSDGVGSNSGIIDGIQWVAQEVKAKGLTGKAVLNMSLGGKFSEAVNNAIESLTEDGILSVVAAGNEGTDASTVSPASAPSAITVGAIDASSDALATFSNYGSVVDIFAPGVNIVSAGITSDDATDNMSGTSMACPHVAGLAAYLMALQGGASPADITQLIKDLASQTGAQVRNNHADTTDLIAWNGNQYTLPE
jgi:subtilisin family serine protease